MARDTQDGAGEDTVRVVERNIEALLAHRKAKEDELTRQDQLAEAISRFAGSMAFVWLHLLAYGAWVAINLGAIPACRASTRPS